MANASSRRILAPDRPARAPVALALLLGLLSMLLPGLGQVLYGRLRRGLIFIALTAAILVPVALLAAGGLDAALPLLVNPDALLGLQVGNVVLGGVRLVAALDVFLLVARGRFLGALHHLSAGLAALILVVITAVPHVAAAGYGRTVKELLTTVFVADEVTTKQAEPTETDPPVTTGPVGPPDGASGPAGRPPASGEVHAELHLEWEVRDRLTVAVLGSDAGPGRRGARADAILVVSVEPSTGALTTISVPRNLERFPIPDGLSDLVAGCPDRLGYQLLSGLYACLNDPQHAQAAAQRYYPAERDPAARGVADTLEALLALPIDHYAVVDLGGFVDVIDTLGGVVVEVTRPINVRLSPPRPGDAWQVYRLPTGEQQLTGAEALAYVRSRTGTTDYDRMRRQRCLVGALVEQTDTGELIRALPQLGEVITERVRTDVPVVALPALIRLAGNVDLDRTATIGLTPPRFQDADNSPRLAAIQAAVATAIDTPAAAADGDAGVLTSAETCA